MSTKRREPHAIIRPIAYTGNKGGIVLTGNYPGERGKLNYFLQHGVVVQKLEKKQIEHNIRFTDVNLQYNIYDDDASYDSKAEINFYRNHPLVNVIGEKRKPSAKFEMEFVQKLKKEKVDSTEQIMEVMFAVKGMSAREKKDLMYFFKQNPSDRTDTDIFMYLCDLHTGLLTTDNEKRALFVERFIKQQGKDVLLNTQIRIDINKGIESGYLTEKAGILYFDSINMGSSEEARIAYFIDNPIQYENMKKSFVENGFAEAGLDAKKKEPKVDIAWEEANKMAQEAKAEGKK